MPNFDRRGPAGNGPKTGQGQGHCNDNQQSTNLGRGSGQGIGRGCCPRNQFFRNANNCVSLDEQEKILENRLAAVKLAKQESNS